jgi:hypothetical protein
MWIAHSVCSEWHVPTAVTNSMQSSQAPP